MPWWRVPTGILDGIKESPFSILKIHTIFLLKNDEDLIPLLGKNVQFN